MIHSLVACVGDRHVAIGADDKLSDHRVPGVVAPHELRLSHRVPGAGELKTRLKSEIRDRSVIRDRIVLPCLVCHADRGSYGAFLQAPNNGGMCLRSFTHGSCFFFRSIKKVNL